MNERTRILIVGAGKGGQSLIESFSDEPSIELAGVIDINPQALGLKIASERDIPTYLNLDKALEEAGADVVINVTGNENLTSSLMERLKGDAICIGGDTARFIWKLVEEKDRNLENLGRLYEIGIRLTSFTSSDALFAFFLAQTKELIGADAASVAIYEEKLNELRMVASDGFSKEFQANSLTWKVRGKGLTATIFNSKEPVVVDDIDSAPFTLNPTLEKEGVRALMASTLRSENRIIGISYVDSFAPRRFQKRDISLFKLLSTQAAVAIEKACILERFYEMAYEDELTGLNNYRYFLESLRKEFKRLRRHNHPFAILLMDIDHFKGYNDSFGHEAGNYILLRLGYIIKRCFRTTDITARYGGEEFVVVLLEVGKEDARRKAEEFRERCCEELRPEKDPRIFRNVTVSIGIANYPDDDCADIDSLIRKADSALYKAKEGGRNRVVG